MTYAEVHKDVYKNELGLIALRFRRPPAIGKFTGAKVATRLGEVNFTVFFFSIECMTEYSTNFIDFLNDYYCVTQYFSFCVV